MLINVHDYDGVKLVELSELIKTLQEGAWNIEMGKSKELQLHHKETTEYIEMRGRGLALQNLIEQLEDML